MWEFKRGDTFQFSQLMPADWPAGNWAAACRLFDKKTSTYFVVQATLTPVTVDTLPRLLLSLFAAPASTSLWPVAKLFGDVQFTDSSVTPAFVRTTKGDFIVPVVADRAI